MPITLPDGFGIATVELRTAGDAGPAINVWGYDTNAATAQENAEAFRDGYQTDIMPVLTVSVFLQRVKTIQRDGAVYSTGETTSTEEGGVDALSCPPNVAYIAKKLTAAAGRGGRGRVYLPGVDETKVDSGGFVDSATLADIQDGLNAFTLGFIGQLVILHRNPADPSDYDFAAPTLITSVQIESKVATQRRRLR